MGADLISSKSWGVNFEKLIDEAFFKNRDIKDILSSQEVKSAFGKLFLPQ
jgi:hypothetical protein